MWLLCLLIMLGEVSGGSGGYQLEIMTYVMQGLLATFTSTRSCSQEMHQMSLLIMESLLTASDLRLRHHRSIDFQNQFQRLEEEHFFTGCIPGCTHCCWYQLPL